MRYLIVPMLIAVSLAGCAGDEAPAGPGTVPTDPAELQEGRGAIAGLLVDDRFRPIQLTDDPQTEFQAEGFVLLQETGEQVQTTENGEFLFPDLEPGTYTVRVTADGHEATPQKASVTQGTFEEISVVARRIVNTAGTLITNEYSVFIPCAADYFINGGNIPCDLDFSEDAYSSKYDSDLTDMADLSYVITDFRANQESGYHIQIRPYSNPNYATAIWQGDYVQIVLEKGVKNDVWEETVYGGENLVFDNAEAFETIFFVEHLTLREESPGCCGFGATLGVKGQFVQSIFLGDPEVDLESYCALC